jgi:chorismate mutase-like protein
VDVIRNWMMSRALAAMVVVGAGLAMIATAAPAIDAGVPAAAGHDTRSSLDAARTALSLSDQRLSLMRGVMASKWASRTPVEDLAQERTVLDGARAAARERGLDEDGVAGVFVQEISAAKVVQLGWGGEWLLHGFPADEPGPDLAAIRAQLAALTPRIIDALAGLDGLGCVPHVRRRLLRESRHLVRTQYVTDDVRAGLVDALLQVRPAGRDVRRRC